MSSMPVVNEIGPDLYRLSVFVPEFDIQFNQFLVKDDEPLLFHAGLKAMFPLFKAGIESILDPSSLRWIGFSHFESDECGALNDWLALAPQATAVCSDVGAMVSVNDFAAREARGLTDGEVLETGRHRFRMVRTPHLPHGWDASMLFEETGKTLFCSDLFHQGGDVEPLTEKDVVGRSVEILKAYQQGPLADYAPFTPRTAGLFAKLAELAPARLAVMHGSSWEGDGAAALNELRSVFAEIYGRQ